MLAHRTRHAPSISALFLRKTAHLRKRPRSQRGQSDCTVRTCMPRYSTAASDLLRVEKSRVKATLVLSNGMTVHGCFFIARNSRTHAGPESVRDMLNSEAGFFPFDAVRSEEMTTILYNRDHLLFIELEDRNEPCRDPGYDVATEKIATILMSNGMRLRGVVRVFRPHGNDRLSDFARAQENFRYVEAANATYIINVHHVVELAEEPPVL